MSSTWNPPFREEREEKERRRRLLDKYAMKYTNHGYDAFKAFRDERPKHDDLIVPVHRGETLSLIGKQPPSVPIVDQEEKWKKLAGAHNVTVTSDDEPEHAQYVIPSCAISPSSSEVEEDEVDEEQKAVQNGLTAAEEARRMEYFPDDVIVEGRVRIVPPRKPRPPHKIHILDRPARSNAVPLGGPRVSAVDGGFVLVFDGSTMRPYRVYRRQQFIPCASIRLDRLSSHEQLTCVSFINTRPSFALGFADGNISVGYMNMDHSSHKGRGRFNFVNVVAPADPRSPITHVEQHPITSRIVAYSFFRPYQNVYVVRVVDMWKIEDTEKVESVSKMERVLFPRYEDEKEKPFGAVQGFEDGLIPLVSTKEIKPRRTARILSIQTDERVNDLMWFTDRPALLMVFTEKSMRLFDCEKEGRQKLLKSARLSRPLHSGQQNPARPNLFAAVQNNRVLLFDRRCFNAPIATVTLPREALGNGVPNILRWCSSNMYRLVVHHEKSQKGSFVHFSYFPNCDALSDGLDKVNEQLAPFFPSRRIEKIDEPRKKPVKWKNSREYNCPIVSFDHDMEEEDLVLPPIQCGNMPEEWRNPNGPLTLRMNGRCKEEQIPSKYSGSLRRVQSEPQLLTTDDLGRPMHPHKRFILRSDASPLEWLEESIEWQAYYERGLVHRRTRSLERRSTERHPAIVAPYAEAEDLQRPLRAYRRPGIDPDAELHEIVFPVNDTNILDPRNGECILNNKNSKHSMERAPSVCDSALSTSSYSDVAMVPGPDVIEMKDVRRVDYPMNATRYPISLGNCYSAIIGRPLPYLRGNIDHSKFFVTHDETKNGKMSRTKARRMKRARQLDKIAFSHLQEGDDSMDSEDERWIEQHLHSSCVDHSPSKNNFDQDFAYEIRRIRQCLSDNDEYPESIDGNDDFFRSVKNPMPDSDLFEAIPKRSLFGAAEEKIQREKCRRMLADGRLPLFQIKTVELPVTDPRHISFFSYTPHLLVIGSAAEGAMCPNMAYINMPHFPDPHLVQEDAKSGMPVSADLDVHVRSLIGEEGMHNLKMMSNAGFLEFDNTDIHKGFMESGVNGLRKCLEDSDANRFFLDWFERVFTDNHVKDFHKGEPKRFIEDKVYSDSSDDEEHKRKKKKSVFADKEPKSKPALRKQKIYKKKRQQFLKKRRACEKLGIDWRTIWPSRWEQRQKTLIELFQHGDRKRDITWPAIPEGLVYSASSDSDILAEFPPPVKVHIPSSFEDRGFDFKREEVLIARETLEIEIIKEYRSRGEIPPLMFNYDQNGHMIEPKSATRDDEKYADVHKTRTLLKRIMDRDKRIRDLKRRKSLIEDREEEEARNDDYDNFVRDLYELVDGLKGKKNRTTKLLFMHFSECKYQRGGRMYGKGWKRNKIRQHKKLERWMDLADHIYALRMRQTKNEKEQRRKDRMLKRAAHKAKKYMREIYRRDVNRLYVEAMEEHQLREKAACNEFDIPVFLSVYEDTVINIAARQFKSHDEAFKAIMREKLRPGRYDTEFDEEYSSDMTEASLPEGEKQERSWSSLSDTPSNGSEQTEKSWRVTNEEERSMEIFHPPTSSEEENTEEDPVLRKLSARKLAERRSEEAFQRMDIQPPLESLKNKPMIDDIPTEYAPKYAWGFHKDIKLETPVYELPAVQCDPIKQLPYIPKFDLKPPPEVIPEKPRKPRNRMQRMFQRVRKAKIQAELRRDEREKEYEIGYAEMMERLDRNDLKISDNGFSPSLWKARRESAREIWEKDFDSVAMLLKHPNGHNSHHHHQQQKTSFARAFFNFRRRTISNSLPEQKPKKNGIKIYPNGSIWPVPKERTKIFDKFDHLTNPWARKPAADPEGPRPRPTMFDTSEHYEEYGTAALPAFPGDDKNQDGRKVANNIDLYFPYYYAVTQGRRDKRRRKWDLKQARLQREQKVYAVKIEEQEQKRRERARRRTESVGIPNYSLNERINIIHTSLSHPWLRRPESVMELPVDFPLDALPRVFSAPELFNCAHPNADYSDYSEAFALLFYEEPRPETQDEYEKRVTDEFGQLLDKLVKGGDNGYVNKKKDVNGVIVEGVEEEPKEDDGGLPNRRDDYDEECEANDREIAKLMVNWKPYVDPVQEAIKLRREELDRKIAEWKTLPLVRNGVDYWGLSDKEIEELVIEEEEEAERIRIANLPPPPKKKKPRRQHRLNYFSVSKGELVEVEDFRESASSTDDSDDGEGWEPPASPIPSTPRLTPEPPVSSRQKKSIESARRRARETAIDIACEDEAWDLYLEYNETPFHHNSYGKKPVVYKKELNPLRHMPRHLLIQYIDMTQLKLAEDRLHKVQMKMIKKKKTKHQRKPFPHEIMVPAPLKPRSKQLVNFNHQLTEVLLEPAKSKGDLWEPRPILKKRPASPIYEPPPVFVPDDSPLSSSEEEDRAIAAFEAAVAKEEEQDSTQEDPKAWIRHGLVPVKKYFIHCCIGVPGLIHIASTEREVRKEYIRDTRLLGTFYFMRSEQRISVLRSIGFCDYDSDEISQMLEDRRMAHENPFSIALDAMCMGQGTYTFNFLTRIYRDGWVAHQGEDLRIRTEAKAILDFFLLYGDYRLTYVEDCEVERVEKRRSIMRVYMTYKEFEDHNVFVRAMMAFILTLIYPQTKFFLDELVNFKTLPMHYRVAFATLLTEDSHEWYDTLVQLLTELHPGDISRFVFTGVGRHPDCINAILEFAHQTRDVAFASFLLMTGRCFEARAEVRPREHYKKRISKVHDPRAESVKYYVKTLRSMDRTSRKEKKLMFYPELVMGEVSILCLSAYEKMYETMTEKWRPPYTQAFPYALLYPQTDLATLENQARVVLRHYAFALQSTQNWAAAGIVMSMMRDAAGLDGPFQFENNFEWACSFCDTPVSNGRIVARIERKETQRKLQEAKEAHAEEQRKRIAMGLPALPFPNVMGKQRIGADADDVDRTLRKTACLACRKTMPRCSVCFMNMGNIMPNEEGTDGPVIGFTFACCRKCFHGGHPRHYEEWFETHTTCPVNQCTCECDFDNFKNTLKTDESIPKRIAGCKDVYEGCHQGAPRIPSPEPEPSDDNPYSML